ncbi:MAG: hypothetical protein KatS3mg078_1982 [Deltaproteobacteria bacterium]|jgi:hypothetical protein|nr:MAG: hypothetical protein KatS3mg078_1982 [Deltaproteobacteria bacterium]
MGYRPLALIFLIFLSSCVAGNTTFHETPSALGVIAIVIVTLSLFAITLGAVKAIFELLFKEG